jgi:hypothetical protein
MKQQLWRWNWRSGGWNQCYASSREEALLIARRKGKRILFVNEESVYKVDDMHKIIIKENKK